MSQYMSQENKEWARNLRKVLKSISTKVHVSVEKGKVTFSAGRSNIIIFLYDEDEPYFCIETKNSMTLFIYPGGLTRRDSIFGERNRPEEAHRFIFQNDPHGIKELAVILNERNPNNNPDIYQAMLDADEIYRHKFRGKLSAEKFGF